MSIPKGTIDIGVSFWRAISRLNGDYDPYNGPLDAPCILCGYNGAGYWQEGTHHEDCPWYEVGGLQERIEYAREVLKEG